MDSHLALVKNEAPPYEKRVLPRFPFSSMSFKPQADKAKVYEVRDISSRGMQLCLRDGGHPYRIGDKLSGNLRWNGSTLEIHGEVRWISSGNLGVNFTDANMTKKLSNNFLSTHNLIQGLRAIHLVPMELNLPNNLKYWLRCDGPLELFVWQHSDGELSRFQIIMLDNYIEWDDGKGIKTAQIMEVDDRQTPLTEEDELTLKWDMTPRQEALQLALDIVSALDESYIPSMTLDFMRVKLSL